MLEPALPWVNMRRLTHPLTLILVCHIVLGAAFSLATPIFEAPDEAQHFLFIRHLQIVMALPEQTLNQEGPRAHHPPLYFLIGALVSAWAPEAGGAEHVESNFNGNFWFRYGDQTNARKAKYEHTDRERWPFQGPALAVHVIRFLSTVFSTVAVLFTYLMTRQLLPTQRPAALLAAALLAFNPMVLFMSGVVQNSTSALASSAILLYAISRWIRQGFTLARWAGLGVLFSMAALFQTSSLALAAPIAIALAYDAWHQRQFRRLITGGLAFGLPVLLLTGWWFVRNQQLYGDWTANSIVGALWSDQPIMPVEQVYHLLMTGMVGRFGYGLIVEYTDAVYWMAWSLALAALLGLLRLALPNARPALTDVAALWAIHLITMLGVTAALMYYMIFFIRGGHGRYLFTAYPSLAVLLAAGALAWFHAPHHRRVVISGAALSLALALYGLFGLIIPTYAPPRAPTEAELRQLTSLDANIGDTAQVLGYALNTAHLKPGQTLEVTVYWKPLSRTDRPYTVFAHLFHPALGVITQQDTYPGQGNWATTIWEVERVFADTYVLKLPESVQAVREARLLLGLYDANSLQRLPVTGPDAGSPEEAWVIFGNIQIQR